MEVTIQTRKLRERLKSFLEGIDENLKLFCKLVRKDLRDEYDYVIAITGYPSSGKSQLASIIGLLVDFEYEFDVNICFIPTSKEIENSYMKLPMYSFLHVDEASRGLHKQKWYEKVQQKLNELYDVEREGHFLCTALIMPRFQNFAENFRNFRIKYWINLPQRGLAIVYKRDEDKDAKDPWHMDESYKMKFKKWGRKKMYERDMPAIVRMEQQTLNYWFYFNVQEIPKDIWAEYQILKVDSRKISKVFDINTDIENYQDRLNREKLDRWKRIKDLEQQGIKTAIEQSVYLKCSEATIRRIWREMRTMEKIKGNSRPEDNQIKSKERIMEESKL